MRRHRDFVRVPGNPATIASRAAARLAYLGDRVTPLNETSFIWNPQPAEQKLFRCPSAVVVTALPADEPGHANVSFEWETPAWDVLKPVGWLSALAAMGAGALLGSPWWSWLAAAIPGLLVAASPTLMDSGWLNRIRGAVTVGRSRGVEWVPEAEQWLSLGPEERGYVIELLQDAAEAIRTSGDFRDLSYRGTNQKSDELIEGWPRWHRTMGRDPVTDRPRLARGWRATGQVALGRVAVGQAAKGWLALGQAAVGIVAIGQAAVGLVFALGQLGISALGAVAQFAVGLVAAGMMAIGLLTADMGVPQEYAVPAILGVATVMAVLAKLIGKVRVLAFGSERRRQAEQQLDELRQWQPLPDEMSISLAEHLTGEGSERGISLTVSEGDGET